MGQLESKNSLTNELLTPKEVARILKVSPNHPYVLARNGSLPYHKFGKCLRFSRQDVVEFLARTKVKNNA